MPAPSHTPNGYKRPLDAVSSDIRGFTADLCAGRGASAIKQVQLAGSQRLGCCWSPDGMCSACTCVPSHDPRQVRLHQHHQELVRSTAHGQPQKMLRAKAFFFFLIHWEVNIMTSYTHEPYLTYVILVCYRLSTDTEGRCEHKNIEREGNGSIGSGRSCVSAKAHWR